MGALIWCPFPDEDSAARAATTLLDEKLIACANLLGPVRALYEWNGERGDAREVGVLFKTDASLLDKAVARIAWAASLRHARGAWLALRRGRPGDRPMARRPRRLNARYYFTSAQTRRFA